MTTTAGAFQLQQTTVCWISGAFPGSVGPWNARRSGLHQGEHRGAGHLRSRSCRPALSDLGRGGTARLADRRDKVSASALDAKQDQPRPLSPRELRRQAIERTLARAIRGAARDGGQIAYRVILERDDKASTIRAAFRRVKGQEGSADVNLLTVGGGLFVAKRPQRRGRRAAAS